MPTLRGALGRFVAHRRGWPAAAGAGDLKVATEVTEYRARVHLCSCGHKVRAKLAGAAPPTATGPNVHALVASLVARYGLSREDVKELLDQAFGVQLSVGAIHNITDRAVAATAPAVRDIAEQLAAAPTKHCDETGWRHDGERAWVWVVCSKLGALFQIDPKRSREAFYQLLPRLEGVIHTDRWCVYDIIAQEFHQLCHAHLRRDAQTLVDLGPQTKSLGETLVALSDQMFHQWHRFERDEVDRAALQAAMAPIQANWRDALTQANQHQHPKARALGRDLLRQWTSLWRFVELDDVEPTNNRAERAIRPTVLLRKTNGGTRSELGLAFVGQLQSVLATARCQKTAALQYLQGAFDALLTRQALPLLLPRPSG